MLAKHFISKVQCIFSQFLQVHMKFAQNKWPSFDDSSFLCNSIHSHLVFWETFSEPLRRIFSNFCRLSTKVGVENSRFECKLLQTTKYWLNYWKINFFLLLREISIAHAHSPNTILNISRDIKHFLDFLHNCLCNKVISALFLHMHSASADYGRCRTQNKSQFHEIFTTADGRTLCLHTIVWKEGHSLRNWCFDLIERMKKGQRNASYLTLTLSLLSLKEGHDVKLLN